MTNHNNFDVIVMGAGPAGSTSAALLAQHGHKVALLEKDKFPRHHVGESLMPSTYSTFQRLGILEQLKEIGFVRKHSVQFISETGQEFKPFYFSETNDHESAVTFQVERDKFDHMLLENAKKYGVTVFEETPVRELVFDNERLTAIKTGNINDMTTWNAKVIVDATGQNGLISKKLKTRMPDPKLKKTAIYSYYKNAQRDSGIDEGATVIVHTPEKKGWFWYIPLQNNTVSVGVVADADYLFQNSKDLEKVYLQQIESCPAIKKRLEKAERVLDIFACRDFSYKSRKVAGDGYVLVGDALGFIDPVYSTGVFLALKSGEFAADAIHEALLANDVSENKLASFADKIVPGIESFRKFVYSFYDENFSVGKFLKEYPQYRQNIIDLLTGDVFKEGVDDIFPAMEKFNMSVFV